MTTETCKMIYDLTWFAHAKCGNREDAKDLIQDLLLKILLHDGKIDNLYAKEKRNYIMRAITNEHLSKMRYKCASKRNMCSDIPGKTNAEVYSRLELKELKEKAKGHQFCETLFLYAAGYKNIEIAEMKGQKLTTVLSQCFRARKFLRA